jgi:hypothetical protein
MQALHTKVISNLLFSRPAHHLAALILRSRERGSATRRTERQEGAMPSAWPPQEAGRSHHGLFVVATSPGTLGFRLRPIPSKSPAEARCITATADILLLRPTCISPPARCWPEHPAMPVSVCAAPSLRRVLTDRRYIVLNPWIQKLLSNKL